MQHATSVIICAYTLKRWPDLVRAVESLRRQTLRPQETIVVIDHNPALLEKVRTELPDVLAVENDEDKGLSGARNSGLRAASGEILVFLDDDAVAAPNWLEQLVHGYDDQRVVGIGGSSQPAWDEARPSWFPEEFNWVVGCTYLGLPVTTATVRNLIGCNMSFRREVFDTVGGFRNGIGRIDTVPLGCEETELCIRTSQVWPDRVMLYEPNAKVFHKVPPGRANFGYFFSRCYAEGLAKAAVSRFVGARDGLSSEWTYTLKTLPSGVARGFADAASGRDLGGFGRAAAIVAGLAVTTAGYLTGRLKGKPLSGAASLPVGQAPQAEASIQ